MVIKSGHSTLIKSMCSKPRKCMLLNSSRNILLEYTYIGGVVESTPLADFAVHLQREPDSKSTTSSMIPIS
jgi:hypothetical protein